VDKVPGPDGFTAQFLQVTWNIIRSDLMLVFSMLSSIWTHNISMVSIGDLMLVFSMLSGIWTHNISMASMGI
jgi:hypothetical protein